MKQVAIDPDLAKGLERLSQPIYTRVLFERLIERAQVDNEYDGRDLIEALDPFATLIALATHVEYVKIDPIHLKLGLVYARGQYATSQHVLIIGQIVRLTYDRNAVQKVLGTVDQMIQMAVFGAQTDRAIMVPQMLNGIPQFLF